MKISLVTGGAGFIGSHLCDSLLEDRHKVFCFDNLITGRKENIEHLKDNKNFVFFQHDVIQELPKINQALDYIFHLASPASPKAYYQYPLETIWVNALGTQNLLELAKEHQADFLLASTSEVYGDPLEHPQKETYFGNVNPLGLRACYDESKRFAEMLTSVYIRQFQTDARIIRIFNTYGPRMEKEDGRVMPAFISQALKGIPFTIKGEGTQTRSFCFITDMVDGIKRAMFKDDTRGEVFNLGNPEEYTVLQLARIIAETVGIKPRFEYSPLPENDPQRRKPDIEKAKRQLDFQPKVSLKEGLSKTIEYFRTRI